VHPKICKLLGTDHGPLIDLMREVRRQQRIKKALVASGVRMDLAQRSPAYMRELVQHHTGGHLKIAPEHTDPEVLRLMKKPSIEDFESFARRFGKISQQAGKKQYLIPYFIASHPGCDLHAMIQLALFLKRNNFRPEQVQDFYPVPFDVATCMYHTGIDPMTREEVYVAKGARERRLQRSLLQFYKPENYFDVREALQQAGRDDLIGDGPDCLIPSLPPRDARRKPDRKRPAANGREKQSAARPGGYRPHRKTAERRSRK
jgi:uncharacterized radical SAM protein YgiQ